MPHRRLAAAIARMKAEGNGAGAAEAVDALSAAATAGAGSEPASIAKELQELSIADASDAAREADVEEEEQYVQEMLERSHAIFERVRRGEAEAWAELEKELVLEFEYTSWPILSDETLNRLIQFLLDVILAADTAFVGEEGLEAEAGGMGEKLKEGAPAVALDCTFAALDVLEGMVVARFIKELGEDLERPFDEEGSLAIYRALVVALRLIVAVISLDGYDPAASSGGDGGKGGDGGGAGGDGKGKPAGSPPTTAQTPLVKHPSLSSPRNLLAPKSFTFEDPEDKGKAGGAQRLMVHTKAKAYEPLQYLLTTLYLLSHTAVQTDVTCFWWRPDAVIDELWAPRNLRALIASIELVMDKLENSRDDKDRALLTILIDRWTHTLHGVMCTDSIGRQISSTVPEEDKAKDEVEKPGIECLTAVSTYLGRWMDVRCLPCSCRFCGVQKASMEAMLAKWDRRLAHRLIEAGGVTSIGRVSFWLLQNFRCIEVSGDVTGEDLYRTDVALNTQIVHLAVLSDYECATMAEAPTLRARAVKQAIDSGFLNFLLAYFIPRKLCRLEDRQCETTEDQNKARRLARISCKNCIEFLLLSGDGWITDTCYNARGVVKIEAGINGRMAPAAQRLVELWAEDKRVCGQGEELLEHYSPFFLKLCEIIRLSARYGCMKDLWSQELLDASVNVISTFALLKLRCHAAGASEGSLPAKKSMLCAMATFTDMCSPFFGGRDHYTAASRAVHDCGVLKELLEAAKGHKAATSCIRALSYVSRVELVMSVSTKSNCRPEHMGTMFCNQCRRPPTLERPLRQCGRCKKAYYCCVDCQRQNWKEHEKECVPETPSARECHKRAKRGGAAATTALGAEAGAGAEGGGGGGTPGRAAAGCAQCEGKATGERQLMTCGRCRNVYYCSKECQTKHWVVHRKQCGPDPLLATASAGAAGAVGASAAEAAANGAAAAATGATGSGDTTASG